MIHVLPRLKFILLSLVLLLTTYNISKTTLEIYKSSRRLDELKKEVEAQRGKNEALKRDLEYSSSESFIEQEARNKLGYVRPGEKLLIAPDNAESEEKVLGTAESATDPGVLADDYTPEWFKLFFDID